MFFTSTAYKLHLFTLHDVFAVRNKKCSPLFWYSARFVRFSQFVMTVVSKLGYFEQKCWPGNGSSPKTAGSQSVNMNNVTNKVRTSSS